MKFLSLIVFLGAIVTANAATLEEQVDALTPNEAFRVVQKLKAKSLEPIPEGLFTRASVSLNFGVQRLEQEEFYKTLDSRFKNDSEAENFRRASLDVLWKFGESWRFGLSAGMIGKEASEQIGDQIFQDISLRGNFLHIVAAYQFWLSEKWSLMPALGIGGLMARAEQTTSNDVASTSYDYRYSGEGASGNFALSINYFFNPIFSLGLTLGHFQGKIDDLERSGIAELQSPTELDFTGQYAGLKLAFNL